MAGERKRTNRITSILKRVEMLSLMEHKEKSSVQVGMKMTKRNHMKKMTIKRRKKKGKGRAHD